MPLNIPIVKPSGYIQCGGSHLNDLQPEILKVKVKKVLSFVLHQDKIGINQHFHATLSFKALFVLLSQTEILLSVGSCLIQFMVCLMQGNINLPVAHVGVILC